MRPTCHVYKKSGFPHSSQRPAHSSKGFILDGRCEDTTMLLPYHTHAGSSLPDLLVSTSQLIALSSNSAKTTWIIDTFGSFHPSFLDASLQLSWTLLPDVTVIQSCVFSPILAPFSFTATLCSLKEIHPYSCLCSWGLCRLLTNCMESVFLKCQLVCHGITLMPSGHPLGLVPTERPFCAGDTSGPFKQRILCACVCLCMYVCECEHVHVSVHVCMCVCVYVSMFMYVCMCVHACMSVYMGMFIYECVYIWKPEVSLGCHSLGSVHFVFGESVSHRDLGFTQKGWQAGESHGSSGAGITNGTQSTWLSIWMLGLKLRSHDCVVTLYQLSCLVSSTSYKFFNHLKALEI